MVQIPTIELWVLVFAAVILGSVLTAVAWILVGLLHEHQQKSKFTVILRLPNGDDTMTLHNVEGCQDEHEALVKAVSESERLPVSEATTYLATQPYSAYVFYGKFRAWRY